MDRMVLAASGIFRGGFLAIPNIIPSSIRASRSNKCGKRRATKLVFWAALDIASRVVSLDPGSMRLYQPALPIDRACNKLIKI